MHDIETKFVIGTDGFIRETPGLLQLCETVSSVETPQCNKDTGDDGKLRMWSRGHSFIVRSCGHIDQWHPIYRLDNDTLTTLSCFTLLFTIIIDLRVLPKLS